MHDGIAPRTTGRRAIVTGGSFGLGNAVVRSLVAVGYKVGVIDRLPLGSSIDEGPTVEYVNADLRDTTEVFGAVDELARILGGVDVLVNNAAIYPAYDVLTTPFGEVEEHFRNTHEVNVLGTARCIHAALRHLRLSESGRIINFSSVSILIGTPIRLEAYIASKGAITALTRVHAKVLGQHGITVNAVLPGSFPTLAEEKQTPEEAKAWNEHLLANQVIQRRGRPEEVGDLCVFLASPSSGFITGQCINIDGGWAF